MELVQPPRLGLLSDSKTSQVTVESQFAQHDQSRALSLPSHNIFLGSLQERQQPAPRQQDGERSPAHAESGGQGATNSLIQQTINNDGCVLWPLNVNMHQEVYHAADQVAHVAEERHKAAVSELTATAEENHRSKMAQLMGEANTALEVQAKGYAAAATKLTQEANAGREEIANYVVAKERADKRYLEQWVAASDTIAAMSRARDSTDEEVKRLLDASTRPRFYCAEPGGVGQQDRPRLHDGGAARNSASAVLPTTL
jgi:sarcosine oxidase delta subunit